MMLPRNRFALKVLEPLAQSQCPKLTLVDWTIKGAILGALAAGAYFMNWLATGQFTP